MQSLTDEQRKILGDSIGIVWAHVSKTPPPYGLSRDEWASELMFSLCRAVKSWRPDGGAKFTTWATYYLMNQRTLYLKHRFSCTRDARRTAFMDPEFDCIDGAADEPIAGLIRSDARKQVEEIAQCLPETMRDIVRDKLDGLSQDEIRDKRGITRAALRKRYTESIHRMSNHVFRRRLSPAI